MKNEEYANCIVFVYVRVCVSFSHQKTGYINVRAYWIKPLISKKADQTKFSSTTSKSAAIQRGLLQIIEASTSS